MASKSNGRINKCLDYVSPKYHSVVVNVLNFEGFWPKKLQKKDLKFNNADGSVVDREFVVAPKDIISHVTEMGYMFDIPYISGAYRFRIIFPNKDVDLDDFIANISEQYENAQHLTVPCEITFPKFTIKSSSSVKDVLATMGIKDIFDEKNPAITDMSQTPAYISDILQIGSISVDEQGTVATVVSSVYPQVSYVPSSITEIIDRPFGFEIYESSTGVILFQGRVNNL